MPAINLPDSSGVKASTFLEYDFTAEDTDAKPNQLLFSKNLVQFPKWSCSFCPLSAFRPHDHTAVSAFRPQTAAAHSIQCTCPAAGDSLQTCPMYMRASITLIHACVQVVLEVRGVPYSLTLVDLPGT